MNTRINRTTGIAPSKVTKKDVPYLISLFTVNIKKKPKFQIGDIVRIAKKDLPFKKGYQQSYTDETFQIIDIVTKNPPTYTLMDAVGEIIKGKFYEKEIVKVM
jgi:transposase